MPLRTSRSPIITSELEALNLLSRNPLKNNQQSLVVRGNRARIVVEIFSRERGDHLSTTRHRLHITLARAFVDQGFVKAEWHPAEAGGTKLELSSAGEARLAQLRKEQPAKKK